MENPGFHAHLVLCDAASPMWLCCDEATGPGAQGQRIERGRRARVVFAQA
jgi:hypothetical protein